MNTFFQAECTDRKCRWKGRLKLSRMAAQLEGDRHAAAAHVFHAPTFVLAVK